MVRDRPSRGELETQLAAAREAIERLEASARSSSNSIQEEELEQLSIAVDQLAGLAEELDNVRSGRRRAALEAARQRRRYQELFELAPDGYLVTDGSGVILRANRAAGSLLHVDALHLEGKPLVRYFTASDRSEFHRRIGRIPRDGRSVEWDANLLAQGDREIPVSVHCSASLGDPQGTLRFLVHDLTVLREAERRELAVMQESAKKAQSLEQTKSNFLRLASHELRGPLALIRGYISMLGDGTLGTLPNDAAAALPTLTARIDEMTRMVDDMLDAARIEDGRLQLRTQEFDLCEVATEAVDTMQALAAESHEIVLHAPKPIRVIGDRRRLRTILTNLIDNAIKYSPEGGEISVEVRAADHDGEVMVVDHGLGIPHKQLGSVFRPFGRIVTSETSHIPGTGLGLYLSRELARAQGGDLAISSVEGEGTSATVRLPLA